MMIERPKKSAPDSSAAHRRRRWLLLVAVAGAGAACFLSAHGNSPAFSAGPQAPPVRAAFDSTAAQNQVDDDSKFPHQNQAHMRLPCLLCHRRADNSPQPKRSGHTSCAGCHVQSFAAASGPICAICHTSIEPGRVALKPFPPLKSFDVEFAHTRHRNIDCTACHKPARQGSALSIPTGLRAHTTCYQCHAPRAQAGGRDISSCVTCHKPGTFVRASEWTKAYRISFSHAEHARRKLSCNDCHAIRAGSKAAITSPAPTEHFGTARAASCMSCHNGRRAFGEDFTSCKKCHQGPTFKF